jgi:glycine/D-amino acid oxidase-like deaminating enzyme
MLEIADAVVVGGGLLGTALTYELARRTRRAVLLEANGPGSGATGNGFAWINATSKLDDRDYHLLNAEGVAHYGALATEYGADTLGLYGGGSLFWTAQENAAAVAELRRRGEILQGWSHPATVLNRAEMQALEPKASFPEDAVGLLAPGDMWVDTPRLMRFYVDAALRHKAEFHWHCAAIGFTRSVSGAISTVETPQGRIATRIVVIAAGLDTPALAALAADTPVSGRLQARPITPPLCPVRPEPGLLVETPAGSAPGLAHRTLYPPDSGGLHLRPTPGGGLLIGADDADAAIANKPTAAIPPELSRDLLRRTAIALPELRDYAATGRFEARICVRPVPADDRSIVGPLPGVQGAYLAVTHSGITLGPLLAYLLADEIVVGQPLARLAAYRPTRFQSEVRG